ncbi:MAG: sigma-70 family RNA polymerase sigma factor [Acidobacteriota bacterium]
MVGFISDSDPLRARVARFVSTQWSLVLAAGQRCTPESEQALAALCATYWPPLYSYIRLKGYSVSQAQDLTQSFFTRLLEKNYLQEAKQERGKFRSFLLASLKHFLANEWDREQAQKRGGGMQIISLAEIATAEEKYAFDQTLQTLTPEKLFERRWALTILDRVLTKLAEKFAAAGKKELFEHMKGFLTGSNTQVSYRPMAEQLAMTEGTLKVAVHRLRRQFRELLRDEIAQTVAHPGDSNEIDDEIRYLLAALSQ